MVLKIKNYIAGKFTETDSSIDIYDFSNKEIVANFPDANSADLRNIRRFSQNAQKELMNVKLEDKIKLIKKIYSEYLKDKEILEAVVKIKGDPIKDLTESIKKLESWVDNLEEFLKIVFGSKDSLSNGLKITLNNKEIDIKYFKPRGETCIILSRNMEAYEQFYVLAQGILSGNHLVVRASTSDVATYDFFRLLHKYNGSNYAQLVYFSSEKGFDTVRQLLLQTKQAIIFASSSTINDIIQGTEIPERVLIHKYGTGLPITFVTKNANIKDSAIKIMNGAIESRGCLCVSTSPVFVDKKIIKPLNEELIKLSKSLKKGSPLDIRTDIASYNSDEINYTKKIISESNYSKRYGSIENNSMDLNVLVCDNSSNLLRIEVPGSVVSLVEFDDLDKTIELANEIIEERKLKKWISCSVFGNDQEFMNVKSKIKSYIVKHNLATNNLNLFLPHQGTYFISELIDVTY